MAALSPARTLWTVGHSTRPVEELVMLLGDAGVAALVDVRRFPGSRRHPQYGRDELAAALAAAGIAYRHDERLGGRRRPRPDSPNTAWRNDSFRAYADHLATAELQQAAAALAAQAQERPTSVLCAEAVPWRCHRRLIADLFVARGWRVVHLIGPGRAQEHTLHPDAVPAGEALVYPAGGQRELFAGDTAAPDATS